MKKDRIVILFILAICVLAFAAGYGSHSQYVDFAFRLGTILLFVGCIWYAAGAKIKSFFAGRTEGIAKELEDLRVAKEEAAKSLKNVETRIINLDKECQSILDDYRAQGEAIKSEIIIKAEKTAKQIVSQAKKTAQSEVDKAMDGMRAELSEEIIAATEKLLVQRLGANEHAQLIEKSLTKVVLN